MRSGARAPSRRHARWVPPTTRPSPLWLLPVAHPPPTSLSSPAPRFLPRSPPSLQRAAPRQQPPPRPAPPPAPPHPAIDGRFKLSTLLKLVDLRALDKKTTLLHFVVETVRKNAPGIARVLELQKSVRNAARVSLEELQIKRREADRGLKHVRARTPCRATSRAREAWAPPMHGGVAWAPPMHGGVAWAPPTHGGVAWAPPTNGGVATLPAPITWRGTALLPHASHRCARGMPSLGAPASCFLPLLRA